MGALGIATFICFDVGIRKGQYERQSKRVLGQNVVGRQLIRPKKYLNSFDEVTLGELAQRMESMHGHSDYEALRREMLKGTPTDDIIQGLCTRCWEPRNKRGDDVI